MHCTHKGVGIELKKHALRGAYFGGVCQNQSFCDDCTIISLNAFFWAQFVLHFLNLLLLTFKQRLKIDN